MTLTEKLSKQITKEMEDKHYPTYTKQARYLGNGVYTIAGLYSTDTRELFLMFAALREEIPFKVK
jgi:hypothetical protein